MNSSTISLRAVAIEDLAATRRWRNDPAVAVLSLGRPFPITAANELAWFESLGVGSTPSRAVWAVDSEGQIVGVVQLTDVDWVNQTCWFSLFVGPEHQGNGYGSAATQLACRHAFERFNLRQVRLRVRADNDSAIAIYTRCGFVREGTSIGAVLDKGRPIDMLTMMLANPSDGQATQ